LAVRLVVEDGLPYQAASWHLWRDHRVFVPYATIQMRRFQMALRRRRMGEADFESLRRTGKTRAAQRTQRPPIRPEDD
jgi:hypothetical protein